LQVVDRRKPNVGVWPVTVTPRVIDARPTTLAGPGLSERATVGPSTGFHALEQAMIELAPGGSSARSTGPCEEVLFVLQGVGALRLAGTSHALEPESGAYLRPGEEYELDNTGRNALRIVSVRIPDPEPVPPGAAPRAVVRRLADQAAQDATSEREFRIVADPGSGLQSATHFVGYIPTARAPEHFHTYDEVIYVIEGEGLLYAGQSRSPVAAGSCIQLPARTVHCLENTGDQLMRVVAVFRPAGSPASAYHPDGTPAFPSAPPLPTA
jgi:quercetin dioxygenase-like cupin family protein